MNTSAPGRMHGSEGISAPSSSYNLLEKCVIVELFELLSSHNQIVTKSMLEESLLRYRWGIIPTRTAIDSLVSNGALSTWKNRHVGTEYIRISGHVEVAAAGWRETVKSMHADFISEKGREMCLWAEKARGDSAVRSLERREKAPKGTWSSKENRINRITEIVAALGIAPEQITAKQLEKYARGILRYTTARKALVEAGFLEKEMNPLGDRMPDHYYDTAYHRVDAILRLAKKAGKPYGELTGKDFRSNGLGGLLVERYKGSTARAMAEVDSYLAATRQLKMAQRVKEPLT